MAIIENRLRYPINAETSELFSPAFIQYLISLNDKFTSRIYELRSNRLKILRKYHNGEKLKSPPVTRINLEKWQVPPVPDELRKPGIEISGPASVTGMFINALNPGPDGIRAEGDLDDDEDSSGYTFVDTLRSAHNRLAAVQGTLTYYDIDKKREYKLESGSLPFFMHRERPLSVDENEVLIDNKPVPGCILGTALTLFYVGKAQAERGQGIYFYLPKLESAEEALYWKEFFDYSLEYLPFLKNATIRAVILIESLPAVYQMEEMLYALGPYAAGLNAARWDLKASILEFVMTEPDSVWPDRFGVDIKSTEFLANIFRRLVGVCLKHGAIAIGGMATALPSKDEATNKFAAESIRADKEWESRQGFLRGWVAHIFHMKAAAEPFKQLRASGWQPSSQMMKPENYPIDIQTPKGKITIAGTRRNARLLLEYLEGWLNGRGAKGIDSLAGQPGIHPALMEDLATARISVSQIAQRIRHAAKDSNTGQIHDTALVKHLLQEECQDILKSIFNQVQAGNLSREDYLTAEMNYHKALKISYYWIANYLNLDFRSLGSYTRDQLEEIAAGKEAF